jgi:transcriptional regulator with PAS, ATPase and Fis domain
MDMPDWVTGFPGAVTVSDRNHRILWMNDKAAEVFAADGGRSLIGGDLMACHNERSKGILARMLKEGTPNVYTIEKKGVKKFIYQTPWRDGSGGVAGLVEISLEIPFEMPHFVRG